MKTLLKCSLIVSALAVSGFAVAEDGFDQTPLARYILQPNGPAGDSERFAEMLKREPTAAGEEQADKPESEEYRSPERPYLQDSYPQ